MKATLRRHFFVTRYSFKVLLIYVGSVLEFPDRRIDLPYRGSGPLHMHWVGEIVLEQLTGLAEVSNRMEICRVWPWYLSGNLV